MSEARNAKDSRNDGSAATVLSLRLRLGLSQADFAKLLGGRTSGASISLYEQSRRMPRLSTIYRMIEVAKSYGILLTIDDFRELKLLEKIQT